MMNEMDKSLNEDKRRRRRYRDWRIIGSFGYVFGVLFVLLGLYAYLYYYKTDWMDWIGSAFTPYQNYAIPLIIAGIALFITGYIAEKRAIKKIGSFGYVFGGLFLLVGIYVYLYYKTTWIGQFGLAFQPYQNYVFPILIVGIGLLICGFIAEKRVR
jgi:magnesium-transporting ATPase (P-type)